MTESSPQLAVVIATLDEAERLPGLLRDLSHLDLEADIVVSDGSSSDDTVAIARSAGARALEGPRGRSRQLRAAAEATTAPWLLFLHADTRLPPDARAALVDFLRDPSKTDFAHFAFTLEGSDPFWRFIELGQRLREWMYGLVYGDQGLLVSRTLYERVGGYPEWSFLEDVGMIDRLNHAGTRRRLPAPIVTSPRRYEADGRWKRWLGNVRLITLFRMGTSADALAGRYPPREQPWAPGTTARPGGGETIIVFAKAPRLGEVKTRLARDLGPEDALRIYKVLGRGVVERLRRSPRPVTVYFTPADAEQEIRDWMGSEGLEFRPQVEGDLGQRMHTALREALATARSACVVGSDIPGLDAATIDEAFARLDDDDVAVGPAEDGGYYLLAMREPHPGLFEGIDWGTESVCAQTLARAHALDLSVGTLQRLSDVDTVEDVPAELLS